MTMTKPRENLTLNPNFSVKKKPLLNFACGAVLVSLVLLSTVYSSGNSNSYIYGYGGLAFISVFGVAVGLCLKILVDNFAIGRKFSCLSPLLGELLMGYRWVRALWRVSAPQYSPNFWGLHGLG